MRMFSGGSSNPARRQQPRWLLVPALLGAVMAVAGVRAQAPVDAAAELDQKLIAEAKANPHLLANLKYLCDEIGPRLTGSSNLKKANQWTADRMKAYGLTNVHLEAWSIPEGWQRGPARARIIDPDIGRTIDVASMGWSPGTSGPIQGDVVILQARTSEELAAYKGKLKGAIVLSGPPTQLRSLKELEEPLFLFGKDGGKFKGKGKGPGKGGRFAGFGFMRERTDFLIKEGAAAILSDAGKHFGLLFTTGSWGRGSDRPSALNRIPTLSVAHNHYELLYRLAQRPAPARTRLELDVSNKFIPGPLPVFNTVGEIRGSEKPDEYVIVGAHLDSWDLGQGATDNGTGTSVVLETARVIMKSGVKPRRTIRFCLFTGEEQGLHGSREYVKKHKDELPRISACLVHDTGTGKVIGIGGAGHEALRTILEPQLGSLKALGVTRFTPRPGGGSDHMSFFQAGVPGFMFHQERAGYQYTHHSQADTYDRVREADLVQGVQVMSVAAMRIANLPDLLPRLQTEKK